MSAENTSDDAAAAVATADADVHQLVLQFLSEHGYVDAQAALEREARVATTGCFVPGELERALGAAALRRMGDVDEALVALRRPGMGKHASGPTSCIEALHAGNITCCCWSSDGAWLLTAGADSRVRCSSGSGGSGGSSVQLDSGVVSLDVHPSGRVLAGCMSGGVSVLALAPTGELAQLATWKRHGKYAHCVRWHPGGELFASGSFDHNLHVYRAAGEGYAPLPPIRRDGVVESVAWVCAGELLVASVRGADALAVWSSAELSALDGEAAGGAMPTPTQHWAIDPEGAAVGRAANVLSLVVSPAAEGRWVSAATDAGWIAVLDARRQGAVVRRLARGPARDDLWAGRPCHAWSHCGDYIYATSEEAEGPLLVWDVGTEAVVAELRGHTASVREVAAHPDGTGALASAGFDKAVRLWAAM